MLVFKPIKRSYKHKEITKVLLILLYRPLRSCFQHLHSNSVLVIAEFSISNLTCFRDTQNGSTCTLQSWTTTSVSNCHPYSKHSGGAGMSWGDPTQWDLQSSLCIAMASQDGIYHSKSNLHPSPGWRVLQTPPCSPSTLFRTAFHPGQYTSNYLQSSFRASLILKELKTP